MNKETMKQKISEDFQRRVVDCINLALQDDLNRYLSEFDLDTTNGVPHNIGDWINANIRKNLTSKNIEIIPFSRFCWKGKIIVDRENKLTFSIMRGKRLQQIRKQTREKPHYLQTILAILNEKFKAPIRQFSFFEMDKIAFSQEMIQKDYDSIFNGQVKKEDEFNHCVIAFDTFKGSLSDVRVMFLDKNLDEIDSLSMNNFITPDFSALTKTDHLEEPSEQKKEQSKEALIAIRHSTDSSPDPEKSPISLRKIHKKA